MAEAIPYIELVPGLKHFECTRQRATISIATCGARYVEALAKPGSCRLDLCRSCQIGPMHVDPEQQTRRVAAVKVLLQATSAGLLPADNPRMCVRTGRRDQRLVNRALCVSASNREAEWRRGRNAKGRAPSTFIPLTSRRIGVLIDGKPAYRMIDETQNCQEPLARAIRFTPGVRFHGQRPGTPTWNVDRGAFKYRDAHGCVLLELEDGGALHYIAADRLYQGETPAPVHQDTLVWPVEVAATWLALAGAAEGLQVDEFMPMSIICGGCNSAQLFARERAGRVECRCNACGAEATESVRQGMRTVNRSVGYGCASAFEK